MKILKVIRKITLLITGPLAIAGVSAWVYLHGGRYVTTDNAYIKADIYSVSSEISGNVIEATPHDNQNISQGELLYRLEARPQIIARDRAKAVLANIRRDIDSQKTAYNTYQAEIELAQIEMEYQKSELDRAKKLMDKGNISIDEYEQFVHAWRRSENALKQKQLEQDVARARLIDPALPTEEHPAYQQALAELEKAELDLSYTEVRAPVDGVIVNVSALTGEHIIMGSTLLNIIDTSELWIEANFKETELGNVSSGQQVEITVDTFPDRVFHGRVSSITPATGAEFSLLPAQNSSGNWVKVVQRVKVRIDFTDYNASPALLAGMSSEVKIDTGHERHLPWLN